MQTILATAFGIQVDILNGESNELTKAAAGVFNSVGMSPAFQIFCKHFNWKISIIKYYKIVWLYAVAKNNINVFTYLINNYTCFS